MASKEATDAYLSPPASPSKRKVDPILRNAFRYTISKEEYETLNKYLRTRAPQAIQRKTFSFQACDNLVPEGDDYNAAAVRASLRVFLVSQTGLKIWDLITKRILLKGEPGRSAPLLYMLLCMSFEKLMAMVAKRALLSSVHRHFAYHCLSLQYSCSIG